MATCPNCKTGGLTHTLLADELPAHGCQSCGGLLLSLIAYRHWYETHRNTPPAIPHSETDLAIADSHEAMICTKCSRLMTKYRFAPDLDNRLDYCAHCEDIWLDSGEWELLENIAASGDLTRILTQPWQSRILHQATEEMEIERLRERLGADYDKLVDVREWLWSHEDKDLILAHLYRRHEATK